MHQQQIMKFRTLVIRAVLLVGFSLAVVATAQAQLEHPEPHCSDGDCSAFAEWCMLQGREPMCLGAGTEQEVTVCVGQRAAAGIMNNHPNACYGTCEDPQVCNNPPDSLSQAEQEPQVIDVSQDLVLLQETRIWLLDKQTNNRPTQFSGAVSKKR